MTDSALPLARSSDVERFVITRFASDLGFPTSLCPLADGSILVATTEGDANHSPFGTTDSHLVRLSDADADGVSDGSGILATLPGFVTSLRRIGDLVIALSSGRVGQPPTISFWRIGSASSDPLQEVGRLTLLFPADYAATGGGAHTSYALAVRYSQNLAGTIELYFNIGSLQDNASTDPDLEVGLSATGNLDTVGGKMPPDSIQRVLITENGEKLEVGAPVTIATGVRNAAGLDFDAQGNLYFEDNGFSKDPATNTEVQDVSFSSDELNYVSASELGSVAPDFGFAESYTRYTTGEIVNAKPKFRNPVVSFLPIDGEKSEGAVEISMAPIGFPGDYIGRVFTSFFGKFGVGSANNDENPVVMTDPSTGSYSHFINSRILGNPSGLLATPNALYLADMSRLGILRGSILLPGASQPAPADQAGVIYKVSPLSRGAFVESPSLDQITFDQAMIQWRTSNDSITALELWGGMVLAQAPRQFRVRPLSNDPDSSDFQATLMLNNLEPSTTYSYRALVGDQWAEGQFTTKAATPPAIGWLRQIGDLGEDTGFVVAYGKDGSIYLGGDSGSGGWDGHGNQGRKDGFVAKYDADGNRLWTQWFATDQDDQVRGLTISTDGSVYVGGVTDAGLDGNVSFGSGVSDGFISRLSAEGEKIWTLQIGGESRDLVRSLATGKDGAIFCIGYTSSNSFEGLKPSIDGKTDAFLAKIAPDESVLWGLRIGNGSFDYGMNLVCGSDGSVYATGFSATDSAGSDAFLCKVDAESGAIVWQKMIGTSSNDYAEDIAFGPDGFVYLVLSTDGSLDGRTNNGGRDVAVQKYDANGNRIWTQMIGTSMKEEARKIVAATDGSLYIMGTTSGGLGGQSNSGGDDAFIVKLDAAGREQWTRLIGQAGNDNGWALTVNGNGDLIAAGSTSGSLEQQASLGGQDAFIARLTDGQSATPQATVTITGISRQGEELTAEATLAAGHASAVISYLWQRSRPGGRYRTIEGATGSTYLLGQADVGKYLRVVAKAAIDQVTVTRATSAAILTPVENVNDLPTGTVTLTGLARQGERLTATNTLADADGLRAIRYRWQRGSSATGIYRGIRGARGSTYQLGEADVGKQVRVLARYIDRQGTAEAVPSAATGLVGGSVTAEISIAGQAYANLRSAIAAAAAGSTIELAAGTYNVTKSDSNELDPAKAGTATASLSATTTPDLTIRGAGLAETRIIGNPRIHALQYDETPPVGMVIRDLTLVYSEGAEGYIFAPSSGSIPYNPERLTIDGFSLVNVKLVGSQAGGYNGTYMDITGSRDVLFDGITVDLEGQSGYDPAKGEGGGFLLFNEGGRNLQIRNSLFLEDGYSASVITLFTPDTILDGNRFIGAGLIKQDDGSDPQNSPRGERFYNAGGAFTNNHLSDGAFLDYQYVFSDQGAVWLDYLDKYDPDLKLLVKGNVFDILSGDYGMLIRSDLPAAKINSYLSITANTFNQGVAIRSDLQTPSELIFSANQVNGVAFDRLRVGGAADDVINASPVAGARNWISGGAGNDTLYGSEGGFDAFVFWAPVNGSTNLDRIVNFQRDADPLVASSDKIWLEDSTFPSLASDGGGGVLSASRFAANATGAAAAAGVTQITYNTGNGILAYDRDGAGGQAATPFAVLAGAPTITAADLLLF